MTSPRGDGPLTSRGRHLTTQRGLGGRFRPLYAGVAVSLLGNYVAYITLPILVLEVVGGADSALPFGLAYALETIPTLIFGLVGGVILDRVRLRWAMIVSDIARATAFFYLALTSDVLTLGWIYAASFLVGSFSAVYENALYAILPAIVSRDQLAKANSLIAATQASMFAAGPMLGGAMAALGGPAPGLLFNGATFIFSAIAIYLVGPVGSIPIEEERAGFITETLNGFRFLIGERRLRDSTITAAVANLVFGFIEATFVVMATEVLGTESHDQIGYLITAFGLGSILGASAAPRVIRFLGLGRTMTLGMLTMASGMALLVFSRYGILALTFAFVMLVGIGLVNVPIATIRQLYTPASMLGRVITASRALSWGTLPIGAMVGVLLSAQIAYTPTVRATPLLLMALTLWLLSTTLFSDTFGPTHRGRGHRHGSRKQRDADSGSGENQTHDQEMAGAETERET